MTIQRSQMLPAWDVVLRTGSTLHIRPVSSEDRPALLKFFQKLSPESMHQRFFDVRLPQTAVHDTPVDGGNDEFGLVAEVGGAIIGIAHFARDRHRPERAEVSFTISDQAQGTGIGTRLLEKLAEVARDHDITLFEAVLLESNQAMMDVFLESGFAVSRRSAYGVIHVTFPVQETPEYEDKVAGRSEIAASASMQGIFAPKSIAVIGASRRRGNLGAEVFHNLLATGYTGALYPVNPGATEVEGVRAWNRITDIPGPVELAMIVVPAEHVEAVIDDCIAKSVRAVVVISAGFGETGEEGRNHEKRLLEKVRAAGIRMVGPNCMGVINTDPSVRMQGTFAGIYPPRGNVAMSTQSGALGLAILDYAKRLQIGFSTFISVGNKADVSGNDLIQYWASDAQTSVILLYLESFGNPQKFGRIARRVSRKKPILAVKSGRSTSGARAAASHTGALAASDAIVHDLFRQAGVIRTDTLEELFDAATLLAHQPLPRGRRIGIITNAGGPGILAADACEAQGLNLPTLSEETMKDLRGFLPAAASVGNPVDMIASASPEHYQRTIDAVLKDENVDAVIVIYIPVLPTDADRVISVIQDAGKRNRSKPIVGTIMGAEAQAANLVPVPSFAFPERAVKALARAVGYSEWKKQPIGRVRGFDDIRAEEVREPIHRALQRGGGWLTPAEVDALLSAVRIPIVPTRVVGSENEAVEAASRIGFPVVLKAAGATILHKTEVGGVRLGVTDEKAVRATYADFLTRFGGKLEGVVIQKMISSGVEVMIGAIDEPTFGHVIVYGAGGILVELLADVAFRLQPVSDVDTSDMLEEVRATKLLRGYRGSRPADEIALKEALMRLSALVEICPEIAEMDINPLKVLEQGVVAVDARVRVEVPKPEPPSRRIAY